VKWPREGRIDPARAWGGVAVGTAGLVAIPTILATLHAADATFRWWWPTGRMAIPAAIFLAGAALAALSARRPGRAPQALSDAVGGRTLTTLTSADLFGRQRDAQAERLLAVTQRILGQLPVTEATRTSSPNRS
jgi:hypothetical protein